MLRSIIAAIVLSLILATPAYAQTQTQAANVSALLEKSGQELRQANINLYQMTINLQAPEIDYVSSITQTVVSADATFDRLLAYIFIYSILIDRRDQSLVKQFIPDQAKRALVLADMAVGNINRVIVRMQSNAAIAEAQKARDLIQRMRDEVHRTIPGS